MNLTKQFYKMIRMINKNLPTILSALSVVGVGATTYFTAKAAPEAAGAYKSMEGDPEIDKELAIDIVKAYAPAAISGALTIASIIASTHISNKRFKQISKSYFVLRRDFNDYKLALLTGLGTDAYNKVQQEYSKKYVESENDVLNDDRHIFFDEYSQRTFTATLDDVITAQYNLNRLFTLRGYVSLNDYYDFLGLEKIDGGDLLCWTLDAGEEFYGYTWIDFYNQEYEDEDGGKWYSISMIFEPTMDDYLHYLDYGTSSIGELLDSQKLHGAE